MPEQKQPITLSEAWLRYEAHVRSTLSEKKAEAHLAQTRTALLRYTLPGWGFPLAEGARLTSQECERGLQFLEQVALEQIKDASMLQEKLFDQLGVAGNSRRNYRWALHTFIAWCQQQAWSKAIDLPAERRSTSRQREKKGTATSVRTTPYKARVPYQLSKTERSALLQQQLEDFNHFLTQPQPTSSRKPVSVETAKQVEHYVLRLLGWLHEVQGLPIDALSLETLIPTDISDQGKLSKAAVKATSRGLVDLVHAYLKWLQESRARQATVDDPGILNPHTVLKVLNAWLAVARFVYRQELALVGWKSEENVPTIAALRQLGRETVVNLKAYKSTRDTTLKKHLEWTEFLDLSEKLRLECRLWFPQKTQSKQGGTTRGGSRSLTAIAQSYEQFLCVAFLAYIPPRRQKELRQLKVSFFSDSGLQPDTNHASSEGDLLFPKGKQWWIKLGANTKFDRRLDDSILVPNLRYADGRCFYQYLEEWLLQYDYQADQDKPVTVPGLRSCFQPQHDYLFTQRNGQPYSSASAFMALLRNPAYGLTGEPLTPRTVRHMLDTHFFKTQVFSKVELKCLKSGITGHSQTAEPQDHGQLNLPQVDRQWVAEIAQAFIDEEAKGET